MLKFETIPNGRTQNALHVKHVQIARVLSDLREDAALSLCDDGFRQVLDVCRLPATHLYTQVLLTQAGQRSLYHIATERLNAALSETRRANSLNATAARAALTAQPGKKKEPKRLGNPELRPLLQHLREHLDDDVGLTVLCHALDMPRGVLMDEFLSFILCHHSPYTIVKAAEHHRINIGGFKLVEKYAPNGSLLQPFYVNVSEHAVSFDEDSQRRHVIDSIMHQLDLEECEDIGERISLFGFKTVGEFAANIFDIGEGKFRSAAEVIAIIRNVEPLFDTDHQDEQLNLALASQIQDLEIRTVVSRHDLHEFLDDEEEDDGDDDDDEEEDDEDDAEEFEEEKPEEVVQQPVQPESKLQVMAQRQARTRMGKATDSFYEVAVLGQIVSYLAGTLVLGQDVRVTRVTNR